MLTVSQFRADFPEFSNTTTYPDTLITYWLAVAALLVDPARWGTLATAGQELVTAHYLVLGMRDRAAAAAGNAPGQVVGLQTAKGAADLNVSYGYENVLVEGAQAWNQTTYGQRYFMLARMFGAGGLQINHRC